MELGNGSSVANWGLSGDSDRKQPCAIITHGAVLVAACCLPPRHQWDNETRSRESTLRNRFMSLKAYQTAEDWKTFSKITDRSLQLTVEAILSFIVMPASPALTKVGLKSALNTQWEFLWVADCCFGVLRSHVWLLRDFFSHICITGVFVLAVWTCLLFTNWTEIISFKKSLLRDLWCRLV